MKMQQITKSVDEQAAAHTPGPWYVYNSKRWFPGIESDGCGVSIVIFNEEDPKDERDAMRDRYAGGVQGRTRAECAANARLIAAAPDLLEADTDALDTIAKLIADLAEGGSDVHAQR